MRGVWNSLLSTGSWNRRRLGHRIPVVIGGCARSGTTLLLSALSCHRDLCAIPDETQLLCPGAYWPQGGRIADPDLRGLRRVLVAGPRWRTCRAWVEKTPRNVHNLERIFSSLGRDTKFLHMVRDGRDVTVSRHPRDPSGFWVEPERWVSDVTAGLAWDDHPGVLRIRYEDLVGDYTQTMVRVVEFLGLDWDDAVLHYPATATVQQTDSWSEPARPVTTESVGRWRRPLFDTRVERFLTQPGATMLLERLGYE